VNFQKAIESICDVVIYHSLCVVDVYVFGSVLNNFNSANDIDILVIGDYVDGLLLKEELRRLDLFIPVHVISMTSFEERELDFINSVGASMLVIDKGVGIDFAFYKL